MSNASYVTEEELFALMQSIDQSDVKPPRAQPVFGPGCHSHQPGNEASFRENVTHHLIDRKSFLAFPQIREEVVANALAQIPDALKTDARDTKETLIQKIRSIGWFDEQFPLQGGGRRGKKRVRLTATDYSTPRRKSWSVLVQDAHENNSGSLVRTMYSYGKPNSRIRVLEVEDSDLTDSSVAQKWTKPKFKQSLMRKLRWIAEKYKLQADGARAPAAAPPMKKARREHK